MLNGFGLVWGFELIWSLGPNAVRLRFYSSLVRLWNVWVGGISLEDGGIVQEKTVDLFFFADNITELTSDFSILLFAHFDGLTDSVSKLIQFCQSCASFIRAAGPKVYKMSETVLEGL